MVDYADQISNVTDENIDEFIVMFAKDFSRVVKRLDRRPGNIGSLNLKDNQQQTPRSGHF